MFHVCFIEVYCGSHVHVANVNDYQKQLELCRGHTPCAASEMELALSLGSLGFFLQVKKVAEKDLWDEAKLEPQYSCHNTFGPNFAQY